MTRLLELLIQESGEPGRVKSKRNSAGSLRSGSGKRARDKAARVASGSTEVMVKISGYGKGGAHVKAHLMYISRHTMADKEKVALENDKGQLFDAVDDVKQLFADWRGDIDAKSPPGQAPSRRDTMHMVLSMPGKADPLALRDAVRSFAADNFGANQEYVFALHTDTDNDHCHLAVKCRGFDGRQLHTPAGQVQRWREAFAERLRERGIDAEATPRSLRGVVRRPEKQVLRHIDNPAPEGRAPRQSRVMRSRIEEAASLVQNATAVRELEKHPWEVAVRSTQGRTKAGWLRAAQELKNRPTALKDKDGKVLSNESINYNHIDRSRARAGRIRAAAVAGIGSSHQPGYRGGAADLHQPGDRGSGAGGQAIAVPRLRDMPAGNVVRDQRGAAVFLRANSRNRLDDGRSPDTQMRRAGIGAAANAGEAQRMSLAECNALLAAQIERFVARMPEPLTAREVLRREVQAEVGRCARDPERDPETNNQGIRNENEKGRSR